MFRAVLFDLDGTLLDTLDDLADSMNSVLARMSCPGHPVDAFRYFVGDGVRNLALRALPEGKRDDATVSQCVLAMREEYARRCLDKTRPYDGVLELVDTLIARGVRMAVFSNKPDRFTKMLVAKLLPGRRFEAVQGEEPPKPKKPSPEVPLAIAKRLRLEPGEFAYVGDTNTDMKTAVSAGMFPVGALWGFRKADELLAHGARALIEKPMDLLEILDQPIKKA